MLILAYCIMPNHVHFIAVPEDKNSFSMTFKVTQMRYAHYYHSKNALSGHLWQSRFYSCPLGESHLHEAIRYVENNPVKAGLVKKPQDWEWSSARYHLFNETGIVSLKDISGYIQRDNWKDYLSQNADTSIIKEIKSNTSTGRPSGNESFIAKIEKLLGIRLQPLKPGPKKNN